MDLTVRKSVVPGHHIITMGDPEDGLATEQFPMSDTQLVDAIQTLLQHATTYGLLPLNSSVIEILNR